MMKRTLSGKLLLIAGLLWGTQCAAAVDPVQAGYRAFEQQQWRDAYEYWVPEADRGNAEAQFYLSRLFRDGLGVEPSEVTALTLLMLAAEGGHAAAAYRLGNLYHTGELIEQDGERALYWWRRAAGQGDVAAQLRLAALHYLGWMVEPDHEKTLEWYRRAADNGSQRALVMLDHLEFADSPIYSGSVDVMQVAVSDAALRLMATGVAASGTGSDAVTLVASRQSARLLGQTVTPADLAVDESALLSATPTGDVAVVASQNDLAWIEDQPEDNFTLQLFSSDKRESAERVARMLKSSWRVAIFPFDRFGYRWFGVLAGSFDSMQQATQAKDRLLADNPIESPWIRRFQNVRKRD
ncbi:SPOR domain-containing protein [Sedimenticola selenatireducens]|uniref:SPOR domain-containing protein n=1 Tax=Sedimenticola selenatireducens TaxID=191960 RepID=A0A2N6D0Q3_9GAMM|nr:SPOR domain-containing protein [Sedimenticola selenatireducens]PLX63241.1 MAG: hypothetical protein C0630_03585 [Sedimenticola selenatireducens]